MDSFSLSVEYNGKTYSFEPVFTSSAYSYRFLVMMDDQEIYFEPDEERQLRAIAPPGVTLNKHQLQLIQLIGSELHTLLHG